MTKLIFSLALLFSVSACFGKGLPEVRVKVGAHPLKVELAHTPKTRERGLMERETLKVGAGMLFIFPDETTRYFWMKNTYIPLSIGFFDKSRKLVEIQQMKPMGSPMEKNIPRYQSKRRAKYALEVNQGYFKAKKIKLGAKLTFIDPLPAKVK